MIQNPQTVAQDTRIDRESWLLLPTSLWLVADNCSRLLDGCSYFLEAVVGNNGNVHAQSAENDALKMATDLQIPWHNFATLLLRRTLPFQNVACSPLPPPQNQGCKYGGGGGGQKTFVTPKETNVPGDALSFIVLVPPLLQRLAVGGWRLAVGGGCRLVVPGGYP